MDGVTRVCPQCGNTTYGAECPLDGWATVPERLLSAERLELGTLLLGRYRTGALLKHDGPVAVYGGLDEASNQPVHVHIVPVPVGTSLATVARMQRAARVLETLRHPSLVAVLASGTTARGDLVIVTERGAATTLADKLRAGALGVPRTVELGHTLFAGLEAAHGAGVAHHDLTPDRVLIDKDDKVRIDRFGLIDILRLSRPDDGDLPLSRHGVPYGAPELARDKLVTRQADIYSVGAILYEALTGRPVFDEPTPADQLVAHLVRLPPSPSVDGATMQGPLVDLILHCLAKKPWNRPESASLARTAFEQVRQGPAAWPVQALPPLPPPAAEPEPQPLAPAAMMPPPLPTPLMTRDSGRPRMEARTKPHLAPVMIERKRRRNLVGWLAVAAALVLAVWLLNRRGHDGAPTRTATALAPLTGVRGDRAPTKPLPALPGNTLEAAAALSREAVVLVPAPAQPASASGAAHAADAARTARATTGAALTALREAEAPKAAATRPTDETPVSTQAAGGTWLSKKERLAAEAKAAEEARAAANARWKARQGAEQKAMAEAEAKRTAERAARKAQREAQREAAAKAEAAKVATRTEPKAEKDKQLDKAARKDEADKASGDKASGDKASGDKASGDKRAYADAPPAAAFSRAFLSTTPPGANVTIDGRGAGPTPTTLTWPRGSVGHALITLQGYASQRIDLDDAKSGRRLHLELTPAP